jgi:hypothetical protein
MKKVIICLFLLISISLFSIELELINNKQSVRITGDFILEDVHEIITSDADYVELQMRDCKNSGIVGEAQLPIYSKLVTLPNVGNFKITNIRFDSEEISLPGKIAFTGMNDDVNMSDSYYSQNTWYPEEVISISKPNIMRSHRFAQVTITAAQYNPALDKIRVLKNVEFDLDVDSSDRENPLTKVVESSAFDNIAEQNIIGSERSSRSNVGQYLIICPDAVVANLEPLIQEKQKLGFRTRIAPLSETGNDEDLIHDFIQDAYDTWEYPPEYVVLVGDVSGSIDVPSFFVEGYWTPWDVSDHPYTLLAGDDYFPDILIGRISVQNTTELNTVINKIVSYEMNPYTQVNWTTKAIMVTYVQDWYWQFYSPRETVMAVREKLLDYEYTVVDTFIDPWNSGSSNLRNMINTGYSFVNYRGAGAPDYWAGNSGSMFSITDIIQLNNGYMLPMVTSITCGGGDFAYSSMPSVFGETWLNAGTPNLPKGAIGFIGPSEHDTKTWFNNANDMGIYQGITQEGLFRCGEMLLRGKMELYNNYPFSHAWGSSLNSDQFYFYVYNLLGDPGLKVWTTEPQSIAFDYEPVVNTASNFINVTVTQPLFDAQDMIIAITSDDSLVTTGITDATGNVNIPVNLSAGTYSITASKYGYIPQTETFQVGVANIVAVEDYVIDDPISGSNIYLVLDVKNYGNQTADNIEVTLSTETPGIEITSGTANVTTLAAEEVTQCLFELSVAPEWQNGIPAEVFADITSSLGDITSLVAFDIISPEVCLYEFTVMDPEDYLLQNELNTVNIDLLNCGNLDCGEFIAQLIPENDNISVVSNQSLYDPIAVNGTGTNVNAFEVECAEVMSGELAAFRIEITYESVVVQQFSFSIPIGEMTVESPTFSEYGYFAIESSDTGYFEPPVYDWIEISTNHGGSGTEITPFHITPDGKIDTVDLPFDFNYYGETFNTISICSNGYVSLGDTNLIFARNRNIPSGVGASAMIAPFWDKLTGGHVFYQYIEDDDCFVVEWSDMHNDYNYANEVFELILYDPVASGNPDADGIIKFQYDDINNVDQADQYATVGIESPDQSEGLLISYCNTFPETVHQLADETAIIFSTNPAPQVSNDDELPSMNPILGQNYPNPFNPSTIISFNLTSENAKHAELAIYNLKGQKIREFSIDKDQTSLTWDGKDSFDKPVSSGVYFYKLIVNNKSIATRKCLLLK